MAMRQQITARVDGAKDALDPSNLSGIIEALGISPVHLRTAVKDCESDLRRAGEHARKAERIAAAATDKLSRAVSIELYAARRAQERRK